MAEPRVVAQRSCVGILVENKEGARWGSRTVALSGELPAEIPLKASCVT